ARAAAGDELPAAERDGFFQKRGCQRRADAGMNDCAALPVLLQHVDRVLADFAADVMYVVVFGTDAADHVVEEAQDAAFRQADDASQRHPWLDQRGRCVVEFENWIHESPHDITKTPLRTGEAQVRSLI